MLLTSWHLGAGPKIISRKPTVGADEQELHIDNFDSQL